MAAIDKIYARSFEEYDVLKKWALVYYPQLIFYFYDFDLTYNKFLKNRKDWLNEYKRNIRKDAERLGKYENEEEAVQNLIKHYKKSKYNCPLEQAKEEVKSCLKNLERVESGDATLEEEYTFPIMTSPFSVDKKLKWTCPIPFVREYLHKQCGVNPKKEWLYKMFWKGKKHVF